MKAKWEINYWKTGSGYSHSEDVNWSDEEKISTADVLKKSVLDWWYEDGWTDDDHDGHDWTVSYYNTAEDGNLEDDPVEQVEFWVSPDDV